MSREKLQEKAKEELIKNLKYTMRKHKNYKMYTFGTNISSMCKDVIDYLEQEPKTDVLDKIKAEIIDMRSKQNCSCSDCLDIIDKYKAESEGK